MEVQHADLFTGQRFLSPPSPQQSSGKKSQEPRVELSVTESNQQKMDPKLPDRKEVRLLQAVKIPAGMQKVVRNRGRRVMCRSTTVHPI